MGFRCAPTAWCGCSSSPRSRRWQARQKVHAPPCWARALRRGALRSRPLPPARKSPKAAVLLARQRFPARQDSASFHFEVRPLGPSEQRHPGRPERGPRASVLTTPRTAAGRARRGSGHPRVRCRPLPPRSTSWNTNLHAAPPRPPGLRPRRAPSPRPLIREFSAQVLNAPALPRPG